MITAVDTSILVDIITDDTQFIDASYQALQLARKEGKLITCEVVLAELHPLLQNRLPEFLSDFSIEFLPQTFYSSLLAGESMTAYLKNKGKKDRVLPDFLIAAHALHHADRLLTSDRGFHRSYFSNLQILSP
ncbi:MAG: PIN domain-containing protein [Verrucomicrobiota bacterium]